MPFNDNDKWQRFVDKCQEKKACPEGLAWGRLEGDVSFKVGIKNLIKKDWAWAGWIFLNFHNQIPTRRRHELLQYITNTRQKAILCYKHMPLTDAERYALRQKYRWIEGQARG